MVSEVWDSTKDYIKSKFGNPFFGTLIIVWLIWNWRLWFGLFTFDEDTLQEGKLKYISDYFTKDNFFSNLSITILLTFAAVPLRSLPTSNLSLPYPLSPAPKI
ncbi:MAG: hypothetical protein SH856_00230 [Flavobacteriales bacterium]|nr:hypothetical protein [Flavobacteriales bacterium]